jgi:hypothetical protein
MATAQPSRLTTLMAELLSSNASMEASHLLLRFESAEAEVEFLDWARTADPAEAERFASVLGKPSQFVGRVTTLQGAREHWRQWEAWQETEGVALEEQRRTMAVDVPPAPPQPSAIEVEAARKAWHDAVTWAKQNEREWADWKKAELDRINRACKSAEESRRCQVEIAREAYRRLR